MLTKITDDCHITASLKQKPSKIVELTTANQTECLPWTGQPIRGTAKAVGGSLNDLCKLK